METTKKALESRTVWASLIVILAGVAGFAIDENSALEMIDGAVIIGGAVAAIHYRIQASSKIK